MIVHPQKALVCSLTCQLAQEGSGRSKGCGIVHFATPEGAQKAILELNETVRLDMILLSYSTPELFYSQEATTIGGYNRQPARLSSRFTCILFIVNQCLLGGTAN